MWDRFEARALASEHMRVLGRRWSHVQTVGMLAERLVDDMSFSDEIVAAAWLHDIGYSAPLASTGLHSLDGAVFLLGLGAPQEIVGLVAWHTGAVFEAEVRGLADKLRELPVPDASSLDVLTLLDLVSAPDGSPTTPEARVAEILARYNSGDAVHEAVTMSSESLLVSASRARSMLGLSDVWPIGVLEGVGEAQAH